MKIFLTNPIGYPSYKIVFPSLGLLAIASVLKERGYQVKLYDAYLKRPSEENFKKILVDFNPDIIGIGFHVKDRFAGFRTAQLSKQVCSKAKIIGGGPFPSIIHKEILEEYPYFDIIVRGEGETTILKVVQALQEKKPLADIRGITYKAGQSITVNNNRELLKDLNQLPFPAFELLDINEYKSFIPDDKNIKNIEDDKSSFWKKYSGKSVMASLIFSRGCPFNCIFCSTNALWGRGIRMLSPEKAFAQIKYFYNRRVRHFAFQDDHLVTNKKWFFEFCDLIDTLEEPIRYFFSARIDSINEDIIDRAFKTGARIIGFGIENLSDHSLKTMNKRLTSEQIWNTLALVDRYNIQIRGGILINSPDETLEDIALNIRQHKKLRKYLFQSGTVGALEIYPGTQLEKEAGQRGQLKGFSWVKPYFNEYNYVLSAPSHVPLFLNLSFYRIIIRMIKESIKCYDLWLTRTLIREHFVRLKDVSKRKFFNKFKERSAVLSAIFLGIFSFPITEIFHRFIFILKVLKK